MSFSYLAFDDASNGLISISAASASGTFPIPIAFGMVEEREPVVVTHTFGAGSVQREQRYLIGPGVRTFRVPLRTMTASEKATLTTFWANHYGSYTPFTFAWTDASGGSQSATVRFASESLSIEQVSDGIWTGYVELIEVPSSVPTYTATSTLSRFPDSGLLSDLSDQVQEIIPLITIRTKGATPYTIRLSDRRCTVDSVDYHERLSAPPTISQGLNGESDTVSLSLGNADRAFTRLVASVSLKHATVTYSLFHVGSSTKINLWVGHIDTWRLASGSTEFAVECVDGISELRLQWPQKVILRDQGFILPDQPVVAARSGRTTLTSTTVHNESVYGKPVQDVWCSLPANRPMEVPCAVIAERDEGDFRAALGVIGRGPICAFGYKEQGRTNVYGFFDGSPNHGGSNELYGMRRSYGGTPSTGSESPANNQPDNGSDKFALDEIGVALPNQTPPSGVAWQQVRRTDEKGINPRRTSEASMTALICGGLGGWTWSAPGTRSWTQSVSNPVWVAVNVYLSAIGVSGESAATQETWFDCAAAIAAAAVCNAEVDDLVNQGVGNVVNEEILDGEGVGTGVFDTHLNWVSGAKFNSRWYGLTIRIDGDDFTCGTVTNDGAKMLVSGATEGSSLAWTLRPKQFTFNGVLAEQKPLRDWLREILSGALCYYRFDGGKLAIYSRATAENGGLTMDTGSILHDSLSARPIDAEYNSIVVRFGSADYGWQQDSVSYKVEDHVTLIGRQNQAAISAVGCCSKDQAARLAIALVRESLGGISESDWTGARRVALRTTLLSLDVAAGDNIGITHEDVPAENYRAKRWQLNGDYSIDMELETVRSGFYDYTTGPVVETTEPAFVPAPDDPYVPDCTIESVTVEYPEADGGLFALVSAEYTAPLNLGEEPRRFSFVEIWLDTGEAVERIGLREFTGLAGDTDTLTFKHALPTAEATWRVYLVSYPNQLNQVQVPAHPRETPSMTVVVTESSGSDVVVSYA